MNNKDDYNKRIIIATILSTILMILWIRYYGKKTIPAEVLEAQKEVKQEQVIETKEKEVISNHAITGVYYFKSLNNFRDSVIDLVVESDLSKGEFYMSNVFNHLKKFSNKIKVFDIKHFDCVGTPEQLE